MENLRDMLAAKARAVVPGTGYNAYRGEQEAGLGQARPLFFEDALPARNPERALVNTVVPSFARFLQRKKQDVDSPDNVLVALFLGEFCFVLPGESLLDLYCETEGITRLALRFRALGWLDK